MRLSAVKEKIRNGLHVPEGTGKGFPKLSAEGCLTLAWLPIWDALLKLFVAREWWNGRVGLLHREFGNCCWDIFCVVWECATETALQAERGTHPYRYIWALWPVSGYFRVRKVQPCRHIKRCLLQPTLSFYFARSDTEEPSCCPQIVLQVLLSVRLGFWRLHPAAG